MKTEWRRRKTGNQQVTQFSPSAASRSPAPLGKLASA
uniref:Uncharacterized protein n=1 Tax=Anguilla anguilla TaxID=7936 RepID=A0A0E9Q9U7_ANGAN